MRAVTKRGHSRTTTACPLPLRTAGHLSETDSKQCSNSLRSSLDLRHTGVESHVTAAILPATCASRARLLPAGVHDTLLQVREHFWIVSGRELVRKVIRECIVCQCHNSAPASEVTAPLPLYRVTRANLFEVTWVDFANQVFVSCKPQSHRVYATLFTCAVTRAVLLDLVEDITTTSFLHPFRRFISRRGISRVIYRQCMNVLKQEGTTQPLEHNQQ